MEDTISTSASTLNANIHRRIAEHSVEATPPSVSVSVANSPPSSALPSPPDSPSSGSVSSFPSVSSSFFVSSAAASPPHSHPPSDHLPDLTEGLIIPSLTLPSPLRRPTRYGQTIGDIRLLVLGNKTANKGFLTNMLLEDNEAVVDIGNWEDAACGRALYASTDWIEHKDAHGLHRHEPIRNIEIIELPGYDDASDGVELLRNVQEIIHSPFRALSEVLHPDRQPSSLVANLLSSPSTPLFTALVFLLPSAPTTFDRLLITELGSQIPLIVLPRLHSHPQDSSPLGKLSSFRPSTAVALRSGLFNSPEILSLLRGEAADRYLKWREVERAIPYVQSSSRFAQPKRSSWDKEKWESEYLTSFSHDVAKRARNTTSRRRTRLGLNTSDESKPLSHESCASLDPLHLPSLFLFSISLLDPLHTRLRSSFYEFLECFSSERSTRVALLGGFCIGLGIGLMARP